jgi:hypothetical protein
VELDLISYERARLLQVNREEMRLFYETIDSIAPKALSISATALEDYDRINSKTKTVILVKRVVMANDRPVDRVIVILTEDEFIQKKAVKRK